MDSPVKSGTVRERQQLTVGPPDGGYGWFILLACFLVFGLTFGVIKAFGVFYMEIHSYFEATATGTSWITSITVATIHCGAPMASALSARYSHRAVVMIGGLLSCVGMVAGAYAQNLVQLYITVGLLTGFLIDKMSDYGTGFLMAGVALIISALFLLLLHQMNRRAQGSARKGHV